MNYPTVMNYSIADYADGKIIVSWYRPRSRSERAINGSRIVSFDKAVAFAKKHEVTHVTMCHERTWRVTTEDWAAERRAQG